MESLMPFVMRPLTQYTPIDFSNIGRMNAMDKQNSMNTAAEERARTRQLDDEQRQRGYLTEDRTYAEGQKLWDEQRAAERQVAERERIEQERLKRNDEAKNRLGEAYKKNDPQAWAGVVTDYPELKAQVDFLVGDLSEQEKAESWADSEKLNSISRSNLPDEKKQEFRNAIIDGKLAAYANNGNKKMASKWGSIKSMYDSESPEAPINEALVNYALNPDRQKFEAQALKIAQDRETLVKTKSEIKKLDAEAADALAKANGALDPVKKAELEFKTRKEYSDQTQVFKGTKDAYSRMEAAEDTAQGDLSLIFSYMKMLDPGSTVREGEFANAQNAAGIDTKIINMYNNLRTGERLSEGQRKGFKGQAKKLYTAAKNEEQIVRKGIDRIAKNYGLNPDNIFYEDEVTDPKSLSVAKLSVMAPDGKEYSFDTPEKLEAFKKAAGIK